jgi:hypothetical protein
MRSPGSKEGFTTTGEVRRSSGSRRGSTRSSGPGRRVCRCERTPSGMLWRTTSPFSRGKERRRLRRRLSHVRRGGMPIESGGDGEFLQAFRRSPLRARTRGERGRRGGRALSRESASHRSAKPSCIRGGSKSKMRIVWWVCWSWGWSCGFRRRDKRSHTLGGSADGSPPCGRATSCSLVDPFTANFFANSEDFQ